MDLSPDEDNFQGRLLHQAALWDNLELLQELLTSGADVNARDANSRSALHAAALAERSRCLAALCEAGADLDAASDAATGGKTALHIAAERGHVENLRTLIGAGASIAAVDAAGDTPLSLAERNCHRHAAMALREARDALERERLAQHSQLRTLVTRGDVQGLRSKLAALGSAAGIVVNLTPGGASTLLYVASESGHASIVSALLEAGADGRAHPVTKYCPLYIASYHGHLDVARLLLADFPRAVQQETVEKWLPLHAACIGGHASMVTLLLEYPYPGDVMNTYTDESGEWQYNFAFDVNARDASGQTALYVACTLGNVPVVEALLGCTVPAVRINESSRPPTPPPSVVSPARAGISLGIHAIVSKLTGGSKHHQDSDTVPRIRPASLSCGRPGDSIVAACARGGHARLLRAVLAAGAPAHAAATPPANQASDLNRSSRRRSRSAAPLARHAPSPSPARGVTPDRDVPWTALAIAARARNVQIVEILLAAGASDPFGLAAAELAKAGLVDALAALLACKAYPDPDYKLNRSSISEALFCNREDSSLTYNALAPTTPVMLDWRELRCQLPSVRMAWVAKACLRVNSKLSSPKNALLALTRIDLANNELRSLPPELFALLSLRYLNAAQNKLERLPTPSDPFEDEGKKGKKAGKRPEVYSAPVLQEIYLQDNRLEELPPELFSLPSLSVLDLCNNKLQALPSQMWSAPALRDLNVALNHLRELPGPAECSSPCPAVNSPSESPLPNSGTPVSSSGTPSEFNFDQSKSWSRSPSIESAESPEEEDGVIILGDRSGNAVWTEARRVHSWRGAVEPSPEPGHPSSTGSQLSSLNLSHNQFSCVPPVLACCAPQLARLNMAYNSLRSMSYVTSYPPNLRQLDLSHNEITCWPSLPQVENFGSGSDSPLSCYCSRSSARSLARPRSGSVRSQLLSAACPPRRHLRLAALRTLILANNLLTRIQLTTDDDGLNSAREASTEDDEDDWSSSSSIKGRLLFPLLSMLDVSCNLLRAVPPAIHELSNLSVLNISGNKDITDLPPQMGLLSRLWNLNTYGCSFSEPLRSMVSCGKYKSMDIVGYLKSVLQEASVYLRMKLMVVGKQGIGKTSLLECLRQESAIQHRRKPTEHWAKRMGNKSSRKNMSTVGVDIGTWVYEKQRSTRGAITFRTWDFGGQQEYYATHQYFLSRRSLYLCVWRCVDGRRGLAHAVEWLRSIQARAPGSPVIMVATHYDQVANSNLPENESPEALQRVIRTAIMGAPDADKLGLPRVLDSLEVSCNTRHNIRLLADMIYSAALSVKPPGSKQALLEQSVPASYLALEECVTSLARTLPDPVLRHAQYKQQVTQYMQSKNYRTFRDAAELHQATMFLHENGVLLHYDDATLKELYFLKPQWLCDVLAHVITVREINPFANNGIMKVEDLAHVFKASPLLSRSEEANSLVVSLLNKFELALCWDARVLLVPPLLPSVEPDQPQLPLRTRTWSRGTPRRAWPSPVLAPLDVVQTNRHTDSPVLINEPWSSVSVGGRSGGRSLRRLLLVSYVPCGFWPRLAVRVLADSALALSKLSKYEPWSSVSVGGRSGGRSLRRLLLVSYVPCGFWPRLAVRVLADSALALAAQSLYSLPREMESDEAMAKALELNWGWKLWKTGLRLVCGDLTIVTLRSLPARSHTLLGGLLGSDEGDQPYRDVRFRVKQEGVWTELDAQSCACVEILLPAHVCVARRDDGLPIAGYQSVSLEPNPEVLAKVLAIVSDHVDLLLEDWYPSLGTRFVHTSEGRCLITRVIPCPDCMRDAQERPEPMQNHLAQAFRRLELGAEPPRRLRLSEESRASDGDSGVGAESNASSRLGSVEGIVNPGPESPAAVVAHAWTVEECILAACSGTRLSCGIHADVALRDVAPDVLLLDVEEEKRARWEQISRSSIAGRGAFGTVLSGCWRCAGTSASVPVALKALQPVPPPAPHDSAALHAYKAALSRWEREPTSAACRAYCGLRQELSVLSQLRHPHVVPLLGVCGAPLALLLELAPQGALDNILRSYAGCGARVGPRAARALALQLSRALEYLHARRIVYRDLKSENVLVWSMPRAAEATAAERSAAPIPVKVKLGDYGISRLAPPSGTKGFGGTEGFMAPEIMRYNGEEEYNEKVDCFSYGMLLYEVVTLRQPFEGHEAVKEAVLDGARPSLSARDLQYPCCLLDSMRRCWSGSPELRPSAAALVSIASAPEYSTLMDAASSRSACQSAAVATPVLAVTDCGAGGWEVWYGGGGGAEPERAHSLLASDTHFTHHHTLRIPPDKAEPVTVTAMCRVGSKVWIGDSAGRINVYSASTCAHQWGVSVREAVGGSPSPVSAVAALAGLQRVAVALQCGRLFLVCASRPEAEGSFVLTELGTATELSCLAVVSTPTGMEVWSGGAGLHVYTVCSAGVRAAQPLAERRVALLAAHDQHVAVYCSPGACIYQWSVVTHAQTARLDCSKLVPCSESLQSIALDEQREGDRFTVTALCSLRSVLYVGTAWGCVIVADHRSLRPLTVFRPYEDEIRVMVPLASHRGAPHDMLVTFGSGYRPLLQRFAPQQNPNQSNSHSGFHCLLWRAQHWLPD